MTTSGDQRATRMVLDNMQKRGLMVEQIGGRAPPTTGCVSRNAPAD